MRAHMYLYVSVNIMPYAHVIGNLIEEVDFFAIFLHLSTSFQLVCWGFH